RVALHVDTLYPSPIDEIVDIVARPRCGERRVDIRLRQAECPRLLLIDVDAERRLIFEHVDANRGKCGIRAGRSEQLVARRLELRARQTAAVQQLERESARLSEAAHR